MMKYLIQHLQFNTPKCFKEYIMAIVCIESSEIVESKISWLKLIVSHGNKKCTNVDSRGRYCNRNKYFAQKIYEKW